MMLYILKSGLCLGLILGVYRLFLEREKMAVFNRWFLLFGLLYSFIVPLISIEYTVIVSEIESIPVYLFDENIMTANHVPQEKSWNWMYYLTMGYGIVVFILMIRLSYHLNNLWQTIKKHQQVNFRGAQLVLLHGDNLPYTFGRYIFVSEELYRMGKIEEELYLHELAHVRQWHSIDVLVVEVLQVFFWFNPILILYKKAIQLNHEFLADSQVIQEFPTIASYQHLLLDKIAQKQSVSLTSNFNFLSTKKRLTMMTKNTSWLKAYSLASMTIPLFCGLLVLFSNKVEAQITPSKTEIKKELELKEMYFQHATFVISRNKDQKVYKSYNTLTEEKKRMLPPPPPMQDQSKELKPLPEGTLVYLDQDNKVRISMAANGDIPPPPPPPPCPPTPLAPPPPPSPKSFPEAYPSPKAQPKKFPKREATVGMMEEFNAIIRHYNAQPNEEKRLEEKDLARLVATRALMSKEQADKIDASYVSIANKEVERLKKEGRFRADR